MNSINLAMHGGHTSLVRLIDILAVFPDNEWDWRIFDYEGVGIAPSGLSMMEFERRVRASELGYVISWLDLKEFARRSEQTYDCLIAAGCAEIPLEADVILRGEHGELSLSYAHSIARNGLSKSILE